MRQIARTRSRMNPVGVLLIALLLPIAAGVSVALVHRIFSADVWDIGPASRAMAVRNLSLGKPLYPDFRVAPYHDVNAYNPLCYYAAAALVALFQPSPMSSLEAGRLLVVFCTTAVCLFIFLNARRSGATAEGAIVAASTFALSPFLQPWGFEFHVDVPALACELAGLYAFQAGTPGAAVLFFELAFFTKQGCAAGLVSMVVYLWLTSHRSNAIKLGAVYLVVTAAVIIFLQSRYSNYLLDTVYSLRPIYDPSAAAYFFAELVGHHVAVFVLAVFSVLRRGFRQSVLPLFWIFAICHDLFAAARWGSNLYYFLPTLAGTAMLAALELSVLLEGWRNRPAIAQVIAATLTAALIIGQFWSLQHGGARLLSALGVGDADKPLGCGGSDFPFDARTIKTLGSIHEPVLTDCPELELINASQELEDPAFMVLAATRLNGNSGKSRLLADIQRRRFAMLALDEHLLGKNYRGVCFFWPQLREAIAQNYVLVQGLGPPFLMVRKPDDCPDCAMSR